MEGHGLKGPDNVTETEPQVHDFAQVIIFSYATVTGVMLFRVRRNVR